MEHYVEKMQASDEYVKRKLEAQLLKTKQEMVKLERMLEEELEEQEGEEEDDDDEGGVRFDD